MKEEKTANSAAPYKIWGENLDGDTLGLHPELPKYLKNLAWLDLDRSEGLEYWKSMELMGRYASANHDIIHQSVLNHLGAVSVLTLENHHSFAWKMQCGDEEVIVHRKGVTPEGEGVIGVIPGSMATPAFVAMAQQKDLGDVVARFDPSGSRWRLPTDEKEEIDNFQVRTFKEIPCQKY